MRKEIKDVADIDGEEGLKAKLATMVSAEVAEELAKVYQKASADFSKSVADAFHAAFEGCIDACEAVANAQDKAGTPITTEALDYVMSMTQHDVLCCLLTMSGRIAAGSHTPGSEYVGHAMVHYENAARDTVKHERAEAMSQFLESILGPRPAEAAPTAPAADAN